MSTFYDTIDLKNLQQMAQALDYPPIALEFAMQVYTGPKAVACRCGTQPLVPCLAGCGRLPRQSAQSYTSMDGLMTSASP